MLRKKRPYVAMGTGLAAWPGLVGYTATDGTEVGLSTIWDDPAEIAAADEAEEDRADEAATRRARARDRYRRNKGFRTKVKGAEYNKRTRSSY
jgi:hypothetical protein